VSQQTSAIANAVQTVTGHARELLRSLCTEHDALQRWDMNKLQGELENRQALVAQLHGSVEALSRQALPETSLDGCSPDELKAQLNQVMELASKDSTELGAAWHVLRELGQTLDQQQRVNASMIILGRQLTEQTMSQLFSEYGGAVPASLTYSAKGVQNSTQMPRRLIGLA